MIDYNEEIPFEKQPPPGFYDTAEDEVDLRPPNFKRLRKQDVVGERRDYKEKVYLHQGIVISTACSLLSILYMTATQNGVVYMYSSNF